MFIRNIFLSLCLVDVCFSSKCIVTFYYIFSFCLTATWISDWNMNIFIKKIIHIKNNDDDDNKDVHFSLKVLLVDILNFHKVQIAVMVWKCS